MEAMVKTVARRFGGGIPVAHVERHPPGHIHDTWFVTTDPGHQLVLQRLNDRVFPDYQQMMDNVLRVAAHLWERACRSGLPDPDRHALSVVRSDDGQALAHDEQGRPWRAFRRVAGASSHEVVETSHHAYHVGRGMGRFLAQVQDLPGPSLQEPIPGFKDFARRREEFELVVELDPFDRASGCWDEIEGVRRYHHLVDTLGEALADGRLPTRIVHNDAKANNVLLDELTGDARCVVDLDTVAPGCVLYDVGDLLRSATVTSSEDASDLAALGVRDNQLEAALHGYLAEAGSLLTDEERSLLPLAGPLMAYENALRFLADHLAGDVYFRIDRPRHNLDRARAQLRVLEALHQAGERVAELVRWG